MSGTASSQQRRLSVNHDRKVRLAHAGRSQERNGFAIGDEAHVAKRFAEVAGVAGVRHLRPQLFRPCTNGKAERFIQTSLRD